MRELQDLPHVEHLKAVWGRSDSECFFLDLFSSQRAFLLSSAALVTCRIVARHFCRSEVAVPSSARLKPPALKSRLHTSLKRRDGRPVDLEPEASSPNRKFFGMRLFSILETWPSQRRRRVVSIECMLAIPALARTSILVMWSCHVRSRSLRRQRRWKVLSRCS